jgi:hypothetical protein
VGLIPKIMRVLQIYGFAARLQQFFFHCMNSYVMSAFVADIKVVGVNIFRDKTKSAGLVVM